MYTHLIVLCNKFPQTQWLNTTSFTMSQLPQVRSPAKLSWVSKAGAPFKVPGVICIQEMSSLEHFNSFVIQAGSCTPASLRLHVIHFKTVNSCEECKQMPNALRKHFTWDSAGVVNPSGTPACLPKPHSWESVCPSGCLLGPLALGSGSDCLIPWFLITLKWHLA